MNPGDAAVLLRVKRAREQHAERSLRQAQAALLRAAKARGRAELAAGQFAVARGVHEAAVYQALTAAPIPASRLCHAAAQLADVAAHAERLGQRVTQAAGHEAACAATKAVAQRTQVKARQESLGVAALQGRLDAAARVAAERRDDVALEELPAHGAPALPGWSRG